MMRPFTLSELAGVCGVHSDEQQVFSGNIIIDSRQAKAGDIFVALRGAHHDGHDFLPSLQAAGVIAAIVERYSADCSLRQWLVPDCVQALGQLAALNRSHFDKTVIGLTGSAGKTTTKEMIAAILAIAGNPLVTSGNLNNHLGVPLTLLRLSREHDCAVIEMGASALGEIRYLSGLVKPDIALVTTVAPAHIEGFGSIENIARGKSEIFESLSASGVAIVNLDNSWTSQWITSLNMNSRVMTYSMQATHQPDADVYASDISQTPDGMTFRLHAGKESLPVLLYFLGLHNVGNAVAAAACSIAAGISLEQVVAGLALARPYKGRLQLHRGLKGCVVIDDSYNANPASVEMAIRVLIAVPVSKCILVLGDMAELGSSSLQLHENIGVLARESGVTSLLACGQQSVGAVRGFGQGASHFTDWQALRDACREMAAPDTVFLVKGSRSAAMERIAEALIVGERNEHLASVSGHSQSSHQVARTPSC